MNSYSKKLRELLDDFDNNKINENGIVNELWEIYSDWNSELNFEPKVKRLIKNYDEYFNSEFDVLKNDIIIFFNNNVIFHKEMLPKRISIQKNNISNINKTNLDKFLDKIGFNENKKLETEEDIFYIWRFK